MKEPGNIANSGGGWEGVMSGVKKGKTFNCLPSNKTAKDDRVAKMAGEAEHIFCSSAVRGPVGTLSNEFRGLIERLNAEENTIQQSSQRCSQTMIVAIMLLTAAVGYPLSTGPAILLLGAAGDPPFLNKIVHRIYDPLFAPPVPYRIPDALYLWVDLWDVYGLRDVPID